MELIDTAIRQNKLSAVDRSQYVRLATTDNAATKMLIDRLLPKELEGFATNPELQELLRLSGRDLYLSGKLDRLRELSPKHYMLKWKEYTGQELPGYKELISPELETQLMADSNEKSELAELMHLSGRDLYIQGKLGRLKELSPESFQLKYQEYFGVACAAK